MLRARTRGEVSADAAFERLHALYAPSVRAWLLLRVRGTEAEDLVQDVWTIFYHRWRRWEQRPGMDEPEARPVLSFLYRTCHFALKGHRRKARLEGAMETDVATARRAPSDSCWGWKRAAASTWRGGSSGPSWTCCWPSWPACPPVRSRKRWA